MNKILLTIVIFVVLLIIVVFNSLKREERVVAVYIAHDQDLSDPIIKKFEMKSGIAVKALYDTEATKTVGLVNRLIAEKNNPQADVFWNNEVMRTIMLKKEKILQPYCSNNSLDIPNSYKDPDCYWIGFGARARVIIYNTNLISQSLESVSVLNLTNPSWKGKTCMGNPLLGTTSTHVAALFAYLGQDNAKNLLMEMKNNEVQILESNSMVRDQVVSGKCWFGLTDTDDAYDAIRESKPIKMLFPDQTDDGMGDLIVPNTVMMIKGTKHQEEAKEFIDFLLSKEVEEDLASSALQMPLKKSSSLPQNVPDVRKIKAINVSYEEIEEQLPVSISFLQDIFVR